MKIMKASAGSGKTHRLAETYTNMLLESEDRYAYRHILAVTFTNKATAEMKSRILKNLFELSSTSEKAKRILRDILHDYSAYSITTIDKFFQQTLKAFSRETGHFASYQIEMDRDSVIAEAMDRILDSLTENDKDLLQWIRATLDDTLQKGEKFSIDASLLDMGKQLKSEEHREKVETFGIDDLKAFDKPRLSAIKKEVRKVIDDFEAKADALRVPKKGNKYNPGKKLLASNAEVADLFGKPYVIYVTARSVESILFSLGLAGEFYKRFDEILKERNIMCLDESNTILKKIIEDSDAPFIYEKTGVRYEHFLLDEFQDTSNIQWDNFLPLLRESESKGGKNLIVGDVKQSIYRFRNSDWNLLGKRVKEQFPGSEEDNLEDNWRSCKAVVEFNNRFFDFAAGKLGKKDLYSGVVQGVRTKDSGQNGQVRVSFTDDILDTVVTSLKAAIAAGAGYGDIAVIVRRNKEGAMVADRLIQEGVPVITDDSLHLKNSLTVRRLVSLLSYLENPADTVCSYLATTLSVNYPESYHSLTDLCENLLRQLKQAEPSVFEGETLFIAGFMDMLRSWIEVNGNDLRLFLRHWNEDKTCLSSPQTSSAVRIITIHKSKGLQFPYVIFPFAGADKLYRPDVHWCHLDTSGTGLDPVLNGVYPVNLTNEMASSLFSADYDREKDLQVVDSLNVFYVALTRAEKSMHVIAAEPTKKFSDALAKGSPEYTKMSEVLYDFCGSCSEYVSGEPYDFTRMPREEKSEDVPLDLSYPSFALGDRLSPSSEASDFFGEDGATGYKASSRISGIVLHGILSQVDKPGGVGDAVREAVLSGALPSDDASSAFELLSSRVAAHPSWFSDRGRNECSIIDSEGKEYRPDRVILCPGKAVVIDYKFGDEKPSYVRQVRKYMSLYRELGYSEVEGYVWYVREDKLTQC